MRSWLFVPGDDQRKLDKAFQCQADAIILDLEDSVATENKGRARQTVLAFLKEAAKETGRPLCFVRTNSLGSPLLEGDLDVVMTAGPDGIVLPKSTSGSDVTALSAKLAVREALHDLPDGRTKILAIATETAASIFGLGTYPNASKRLVGLAWGGEDLAVETGALQRKEPSGDWTEPFRLARNLCLFGASAAEIDAIDTVFTDVRNLEGLQEEAEMAFRDGFDGKLAIHPEQVPIINTAFTPSNDAVAEAQKIIALFEREDEEKMKGVLAHKGRMLDRPHLLAAQKLVAKARSGQKPD